MLRVHVFPCRSDNYGFLLHDPDSGGTVAIDTPDGEAYLREASTMRWTITQIWNTHWHPDHTGGNGVIAAATGAAVAGPPEITRVAPVDRVIRAGDTLALGSWTAQVLDVGGHTREHVAFHIEAAAMAFVGDSLFPLGCGRMFEGTADQFWTSLERLRALPPATQLYCGHEYAQSNARFALSVDPDNAALRARSADIAEKRRRGEPTVPTSLDRERATNPFLRCDDPAMQERWGTAGDPVRTFAALRAAKDAF
ncbi:hydroxyacylglutathione hydrolase [Erythrobacteraceae bacterium CFH 75059]|uniref:hydroxyacylglutathione hydrolase n=1 Tax=Qipengyuania thermophila TaxID=2509361 RepID=UPI001021A723|nr:hydroxyacylglutathione hydrolase [Qipengyuania thermophila]TCD05392.1 hydroxyacylglutathione hydrolase [Erythrobacteraceae bacterium CFH 75059]